MRVLSSSSSSSSAVVPVRRMVYDCSKRYYYGSVSFLGGLSYSSNGSPSSICCSSNGTTCRTSSDFYRTTTRNSSRQRNSGSSFLVVPIQPPPPPPPPPPHQLLLYQRHGTLSSISKTRRNHKYLKINYQGSLHSFSTSTSSSDDMHNSSYYHYDMNDTQLAKDDLLYCMNVVKERDYENGYICGLLSPVHTQQAYFALRAWNVEIASIKDSSAIRYHQRRRHNTDENNENNNDPWNQMNSSSGPPPSIFALQLRMQWWKKAMDVIFQHHHHNNNNYSSSNDNTRTSTLDSITNTTTDTSYWKNPVIRSLHRAMTSPSSQQQQQQSPVLWTKRFMERILEAREADLYMDQYTTIHDCCTYADETISNLLLLSLECCRDSDAGGDLTDDDDLITSAAIGIGLTTLLRATPYRLLASSSSSSTAQSSLDMPLPSELFQPNFPYHNIVSTYMKENQSDSTNVSPSSLSDDMLPTDIDPAIRLKLQRHIPNDQLSTEEKEQFHMAVRTICDMGQNHLSLVVQKLQQPPPHGRWSSAEKMCFLSIIPCQNYLYQLRHRYHYDVFQYMKEQQTNPYRVAKDRIQLFYQLGRTYMTGKYY